MSSVHETAAEWVPLDRLQLWDKNPRKNDGRPVDEVARSIKRFGFGAPIVARMNGEIIAGHTRFKAAKQLGLERVPVRFVNLDPAEAHMLALADNKTGELAEWDDDLLASIVRDFKVDDVDLLEGTGFDADAIETLLAASERDLSGVDEPGDVPELRPEAVSVAGEVYELGPHRLVCGDSRDALAWKALLGDERVQLVWTDPPYGVSYIGKTKDALTIQNDELDADGLETFLQDALSIVAAHCMPGAAWYVAAPPGPLHQTFGTILRDLDVWHQTLVWQKDQFVMGRSDYHYRHEPIFYGWVPGAAHYFCDDRTLDTILCVDRPKRSSDHPTMKPVELVEQCIRNSSERGWLVCDPFGGSGTTLIAAAKEGRVARLIELDPRYCDVIRRRWTAWAREAGVDPGPGALEPADNVAA